MQGGLNMIGNKNFFETVLLNIIFILVWDFIVCCACKLLNDNYFNCNKYIYRIKYWEDNKELYVKRLGIKAWKDKLPQYVSKNGFSKKNLNDLSLKYIDRFILETCRAEWAHKNCMWVALFIIFVNEFFVGSLFLLVVLTINLPYICIQRYNRIRLLKVRDKILNRKKNVSKENISENLVKVLEIADN